MEIADLEETVFGSSKLIAKTKPRRKLEETSELRPVWFDEDDQKVEVNLDQTDRLKKLKKENGDSVVTGDNLGGLLRGRYEQTPLRWTKIGSDVSADAVKEAIGNSTSLVKQELRSGLIDINRCSDVNICDKSIKKTSEMNCIKFHPSYDNLLMSGGSDRLLRLFRVSKEAHSLELSVKFADMAIRSTDFIQSNSNGDASEIFVAGRKPYFYTYDLTAGDLQKQTILQSKGVKSCENMVVSSGERPKLAVASDNGFIHILDATRKSYLMNAKMNTGVRSLAFKDEYTLISSGIDAHVYIWDLRYCKNSACCINRFMNPDGSVTTSLGSNHQSCLSVGSLSGVVTHYDINDTMNPIEVRSLLNLQTSISCIKYNNKGNLFAYASKEKRDQLRIVNSVNGLVYSNWPTSETPLRRVLSFDFNNAKGNVEYLAIGNNVGKILLYEIRG